MTVGFGGVRAVFLDRDGVLNRTFVRDGKPYAPRRLEDFRLVPHTASSVARLRGAGFLTVVVTNQPDIGNGLVAPEVVQAMHRRLAERTGVDAILACPHSQSAGCACRKPEPGLLLEAAATYGIDLAASYMVGDRWSDILAGQKAGCYTLLIKRRYSESQRAKPDVIVQSFSGAVRAILDREMGETSSSGCR